MQERRGGQSCAGGRLHLVPNGRLPKVVSDARSSSYAGACASAWTCSHPCEGASARSSDAPQPVEALLEPQQPRDWVRLSVRDLDVGDVPPREGPSTSARLAPRGSGPLRLGAKQSRITVA